MSAVIVPLVDVTFDADTRTIEGTGETLGYVQLTDRGVKYLWFRADTCDDRGGHWADIFEDGRKAVRWLADVQVAYGTGEALVEPVWLHMEPSWAQEG